MSSLPERRCFREGSACAGKVALRVAIWASVSAFGKTTRKRKNKSPFRNAFSCLGMPSHSTFFTHPLVMMSPGDTCSDSLRPSRWAMSMVAPHRASASVTSTEAIRSHPLRSKRACFCSASTTTTSPSTCSGCWWPSPSNTIFSLSCMPARTSTSISFLSCCMSSPLHSWHLSLLSTKMPVPSQRLQGTWLCSMKPRPRDLTTIFQPDPWQPLHSRLQLAERTPVPEHVLHTRSRSTTTFRRLPMYSSSSVTSSVTLMEGHFGGPRGPRPNMS
mmetsp:Transcript_48364/g.121750  ORF Transcript_48364/g.121750 Transcript_48364/m.121750 type:complete len:273 (-) Transcript_48364:499-1317(-)